MNAPCRGRDATLMNGDAFPSNGDGSRTGETALFSFQEEEEQEGENEEEDAEGDFRGDDVSL